MPNGLADKVYNYVLCTYVRKDCKYNVCAVILIHCMQKCKGKRT